jgi:N-methylhydantoinase B
MHIDPITLEVVRNALQSIAEEMGATLKRTGYSPNIKERKDLSCALFNQKAEMIAQAEHIPVHLGAMISSVEMTIKTFLKDLYPGDVIILNDPYMGGTHLPDITLISPIFYKDELIGFSANRAHHADVGGITPGSLPGASTEIYQEGIIIPPVKLYEKGGLKEDLFALIVKNVRTPEERAGDIKAQISANKIGEKRVLELVEKYGEKTFLTVMDEILNYSERMMRAQIRRFPKGSFEAIDYMDNDGVKDEPVKLKAKVIVEEDTISIDFNGTDPQREGNINAVAAVTASSVFFTLRAITDPSIPANSGCYRPIKIFIPEGTVLNAKPPAAVSAGNVETSQRIVDVLLKAFAQFIPDRVIAGCQGTMNTLTIGGIDPRNGKPYAYCETIGGGQGAKPNGDGIDGVHTHMTNTLNTPIEALEIAYPLMVERYEFNPSSGGLGRYRGGLGIIRTIKVLNHYAIVSLQSERRKFPPYGLFKGKDGRRGRNYIVQQGEKKLFPSKFTIRLNPGDKIHIETPGGGGYGPVSKRSADLIRKDIVSNKYRRNDFRSFHKIKKG